MASEGELEWWKLDDSESKPIRNSPAASVSPPFRSPSRSRPSSSDGPPSLRRFQLQENEDKARTVHQQNLYQLDEQVREKELRKAKEAEEQRRRDEEAADTTPKNAAYPSPAKIGPRCVYTNEATSVDKVCLVWRYNNVSVVDNRHNDPPTTSSSSCTFCKLSSPTVCWFTILYSSTRPLERDRRRREENDAKFQEALYTLSKLQVDLQNQQDQFRVHDVRTCKLQR
ncbi:hypothetical protein Ae201684P_021166 [Aphanomyces euteiches]|nr:hypothetical protein Ae201684P_021166 [Aphanomyces euteiches]